MKYILSCVILFFITSVSQANNTLPLDLPIYNQTLTYMTPLENSGQLQYLLENEIKKHKNWAALIKEKKMSVGIIDLNNAYNPQMASINGDHMMYAASMPKLRFY